MDRFVEVSPDGQIVREWDGQAQNWIWRAEFVESDDRKFLSACGIAPLNDLQAIAIYTKPVTKHIEPVSEIVSDMDSAAMKVEFQPWRVTQSQYHWRGAGEIDLGEVSDA